MDESSDTPRGEPDVSKEAAGDQASPAARAVSSAETGPSDSASIHQVRDLLRAKDDTSRFVGLALLKSLLDNSVEFREDKETISTLWDCISPKFLDRLLKSGGAGSDGKGSQKRDGQDLLDLAVTVLHTFTALLPDQVKREMKLLGRIPALTASVLHSSKETTALTLETLQTLVSFPEGAQVFVSIQDVSPLTEIAPSYPLVLDVLSFSWLNAMAIPEDNRGPLRSKIDETITALVSSFTGTDSVTLLQFLANLLRNLDPEVLPQSPKWLPTVASSIRGLTTSRPTAAGRAAYTTLTATLLQAYPLTVASLLFSPSPAPTPSQPATQKAPSKSSRDDDQKPFSYLLTTLLLIDIRSSLPTLLAQLNTPSAYTPTSTRLAAAFDVLTFFVGHLVRSMDPASPSSSSSSSPLLMPPDLLLKLRKSIAETLSVTIEHLRDRYDAATAGALGLHPDAIAGANPGTRPALAWDGAAARVGEDSLVLAAVRALAIWLREDDNDALRGEAAALMDMLLDLYRDSAGAGAGAGAAPTAQSSRAGEQQPPGQQHLDFRRPVLVALEGITATEEGAEVFLDGSAEQTGEGGWWEALSRDMLGILLQSTSASTSSSPANTVEEASRGLDIVRILLPLVEAEQPGPREAWMAIVTAVAAWHVPDPDSLDRSQPPIPPAGGEPAVGGGGDAAAAAENLALEFYAAALQLVAALLAGAHPGMRRRYAHSAVAVRGAARQLMENARRRRRRGSGATVVDAGLEESLQDVLDTLGGLA